MSSPLISMRRADGAVDSEVHIEGFIIKPDEAGIVLIPANHVIAMLMAGYIHTPQT
jgi:hypothetical protein